MRFSMAASGYGGILGKKKGEDINSWSSSNVQVAMPEMSAWSLIIDNR